ncbi:MAG: 4'-phosphopantetheinyl transferase superfamily protein [Coriobacteriales bacterium]|jgi:acyl transferase domain-containing protein/phosphopantetheinyl transferase|nr:4'-phosphopantetheinyl transferase superfamily protein [Coriobacteriales bacterium]
MVDENKDIAIVGMSVFCPAGESIEEFWDGISRGGDFITDAPADILEPHYFEGKPNGLDRFYCKRGGFSPTFKVDPLRYGILPITASGVDPDQFLSMALVEQALNDAGVFAREIPLQNCAIIIGKGNFSGIIPLRSLDILRTTHQFSALLKFALPELTDRDLEGIRKAYRERLGRYQADMAIGTMPNLVASFVANRFDMHGPAYTVDAACASGILAIDQCVTLLRSGRCDIAVAGGMHTAQNAMFWGAFDMLGAMSHNQQIAPFSKHADGLLIGQGCGFVILKTLRKALEDGDRIYSVIKDTAVSSDGAGSHVTVTSVAGEVRVLEKAWGASGMDRERVGYVEAHGTATQVGDRIEAMALKEFFGDNTHPPALVGSIKSNIGHAMAAAGMMGVIKTALALYHRKIPPTLHCEEPLENLLESRFRLPQEPIDWDDERYPLVAGVNAFGFGGINSHAILTPYEPEPGMPPQPRPKPYLGEAIMLSAPDQETLIAKLKNGDYTNSGGAWRLVVFSPNEDRIQKAISVVERGKSWRGKMDIWFSNEQLLENGGKIAYMFPGYGPEAVLETDTISEVFDLPFMEKMLEEQEDKYTREALRYFLTGWLCREGLDKLGIDAEIYLGHSIGEWNAATFAGIIEGNWEKTIEVIYNWGEIDEYPLVAVSGSDCRAAEQWCAEIPGLYIANDNCPSQILMCGEPQAIDVLLTRLQDEKIFHTKLPYGSGFHTPLWKTSDEQHESLFEGVNIKEGRVPVWSSTTLGTLPTNPDEYREQARDHLQRPVYFRSLIEQLYDEQDARVFVQIGAGPLVAFVEDILKDREFSVIPSTSNIRGGADQLRRVVTSFFIEGKEVDAAFLGVKPMYRVEHDLITLPRGVPSLITALPELAEAIEKRYGVTGPAIALDRDTVVPGNPLLAAVSANMHEAVKAQSELARLFEWMPSFDNAAAMAAIDRRSTARDAQAATTTEDAAEAGAPKKSAPALPPNFEDDLRMTFEEHPYLVDHSIVRQPPDWADYDDLNLVVPFTMTMELLAETALRHAPGRTIISMRRITAYRWISLERPFEGVIKGVWKKPQVLELSLEGYAKAEIVFGDEWPEPPAEFLGDIDIGEKIMESQPPEVFYDRYSFHGPQYHSNVETTKIGARGMTGFARKREGKGSLLDTMGQGLGLFLHLTQTENTISFPVRLKEMTFYNDLFDQEGLFEHAMIVTSLTESSITADMMLKRDGKMWCVAREFVCQRFQNIIPVWNVILKPQCNILADEIAPGVYHYVNTGHDNILALLAKRYLNRSDREEVESLGSQERQREHLISRIALKDAVRVCTQKRAGSEEMLYPIEVSISHDERGKPSVYGQGRAEKLLEGIEISLSHKGRAAVAIAADGPVGIDMEKIEEKSEGFCELTFTEQERELLAKLPTPEGILRFWVAKEACAKKAGTGLEGNPKRFEISAVDGDVLFIGDQKVQTMLLGEENVVGWTL